MSPITAFKPMSKEDVADVLGVSVRTVENWVNEGTLPAPTRLGNRVYWHPNAFYAWLDQRLSAEGSRSCEPRVNEESTRVTDMPTRVGGKSKGRGRPASEKSGLDKLKSRDQAKLEALMA